MTDRQRVDVLGCGVDLVDSAQAIDTVAGFVRDGRAAHVVTFGAEMAVHAQHDPRYRDMVNASDLVVADTIGVVWASRVLGKPLRGRVAGIDLVERLCDVLTRPVYLLGAAEGTASDAAGALKSRHPRLVIAGTHHGYFTDSESPPIANSIRESGAGLVLVALGFPRQEYWIHDQLPHLGAAVCIGVGGAFDVWAGRVQRAPEVWRRLGLEWLYRLTREPGRIGRQLALPSFAVRVVLQRIASAK